MAWLNGWDKRIKIDIDYTNKIGGAVTWFPVVIFLKSGNGETDKVFDEVGVNSRKIAITKADGETELKGEIEKWDSENKVGVIHTSITGWTINANTSIYIYYDNDHADNDNIGIVAGSSPASDVWDSNFKGVWHLKESSGDVKDSTPNNNDGTPVGSVPNPVNGQIGYAQSFDGDGDRFETSDVLEPTSITFSVWASINSLWSSRSIIENILGGGGGIRTSDTDAPTNKIKFQYKTSAGWQSIHRGDLSNNTIYHFVCVFDSVNNEVKIYIDGSQDGVTVEETNEILYSATPEQNKIAIGGLYGGSPPNDFAGWIDEAKISNTVRSAAWIKASYNSGNDSLLTYGNEETTVAGRSHGYIFSKIYKNIKNPAQRIFDIFPLNPANKLPSIQNYIKINNLWRPSPVASIRPAQNKTGPA